MRGIAEIVGVIILIAIGVLIVTGVAISSSRFVITGQPGTACLTETNYLAESVKFNESGNNNLLVKVTNHGRMEVYGFGLALTNDTSFLQFKWDSPLLDQDNIDLDNRLKNGESMYLKVDMTDYPGMGDSLTQIIITNVPCPAYTFRTQLPISLSS